MLPEQGPAGGSADVAQAVSEPAVPEPGSVVLPPWAVESLRERLVLCMDEDLADHQRHEQMVMLVGALQYHLNGWPS